MQVELERRDHAEAATAAAGGPEQIGVFVATGGADHAIRGDDLDRAKVVAAEAEGPHGGADAAAQGEPRDAGH
jgi:hypothetical protein